MEKLLHEQLRDVDKSECSAVMLSGLTGLEARCDIQCAKCISKQHDALADRIEREYIPCQRDQEGKPWRIGDPCIYHDQAAVIHGFGDGDAVCISDAYECDPPLYIWVNNGELSRPAPKVLDADDVEIKAGETLYRITTGEPVTVEALENVKCMEVLDAKGDSWNAQFLTHERPVFDANGERICKGDTVWDLDSGERLHVEEFANRECGLVQCSNEEGGDCEDYDARRLTHREPDSLEKLRDDLYTLAARDDGDIEVEIVIFADRLTALIERG